MKAKSLEITPDFLKLLQAQDQAAFALLVKHHHRQMVHIARSIIGDARITYYAASDMNHLPVMMFY